MAALLLAAVLATEMSPGFLVDAEGLQSNADIAYNNAIDEYLVGYPGVAPWVARVSPCGVVLDAKPIAVADPSHAVSANSVTYNPTHDTYLAVWRHGDPSEVSAQHLDRHGDPTGAVIPIVVRPDGASKPMVAYSPTSDRYVVVMAKGFQRVRWQVLEGDPGASDPKVGGLRLLGNGLFSPSVASGGGQFLVAYGGPDPANAGNSDSFARFISDDGLNLGAPFPVATGVRDQGGPRAAYDPASARWLVAYQDGKDAPTRSFESRAVILDGAGGVITRFDVASTPEWDTGGQPVFNPATGTFFVAWRLGSNDSPTAFMREVDPTGNLIGAAIVISDETPDPNNNGAAHMDLSVRPEPGHSQVFATFKYGHGAAGIYGGIHQVEGACDSGGGDPPAGGDAATPPAGGDASTGDFTGGDPSGGWAGGDEAAAGGDTGSMGSGGDAGRLGAPSPRRRVGTVHHLEGGCAATGTKNGTSWLFVLLLARFWQRRSGWL